MARDGDAHFLQRRFDGLLNGVIRINYASHHKFLCSVDVPRLYTKGLSYSGFRVDGTGTQYRSLRPMGVQTNHRTWGLCYRTSETTV